MKPGDTAPGYPRDVLAGTRSDAASGRQYLAALHRAFAEAGLLDTWAMFMVSSRGGPVAHAAVV